MCHVKHPRRDYHTQKHCGLCTTLLNTILVRNGRDSNVYACWTETKNNVCAQYRSTQYWFVMAETRMFFAYSATVLD